jgi:hypothetical protein
MDRILAEVNSWLLVLILAGAMLIAWGFEWWMRSRLLRTGSSEGSVSKFDDASLALVGLLLAFTFGMKTSAATRRTSAWR